MDYVGGALAIRAWGWLELANEYGDAIIVKQAFNVGLAQFAYDRSNWLTTAVGLPATAPFVTSA